MCNVYVRVYLLTNIALCCANRHILYKLLEIQVKLHLLEHIYTHVASRRTETEKSEGIDNLSRLLL